MSWADQFPLHRPYHKPWKLVNGTTAVYPPPSATYIWRAITKEYCVIRELIGPEEREGAADAWEPQQSRDVSSARPCNNQAS